MLAKPFSVEALNTCAKYDVDTNVMMLFSQYSDERCTELLSSETMRRSSRAFASHSPRSLT